MAKSTVPDGGFHRESACSQTKPGHIPGSMLREVKVQIARWHQGGTVAGLHLLNQMLARENLSDTGLRGSKRGSGPTLHRQLDLNRIKLLKNKN